MKHTIQQQWDYTEKLSSLPAHLPLMFYPRSSASDPAITSFTVCYEPQGIDCEPQAVDPLFIKVVVNDQGIKDEDKRAIMPCTAPDSKVLCF